MYVVFNERFAIFDFDSLCVVFVMLIEGFMR
jgi:hypothetical protein